LDTVERERNEAEGERESTITAEALERLETDYRTKVAAVRQEPTLS